MASKKRTSKSSKSKKEASGILNNPTSLNEFEVAYKHQQDLAEELQKQSNISPRAKFDKGIYQQQQQQQVMKNVMSPPPPPSPPLPPQLPLMKKKFSLSQSKQNIISKNEGKPDVIRPTALMLQAAKAQLRSADAPRAKIFLDRSKLFDSLDSPYFYPLEKLKDIFTVDNATVEFLDLTGVEQLTDVFFAAIQYLHKNSLFCMNLARVTLQGCSHITDLGLKFITDIFPRLQTVSLIGCPVTEKSVSRLLAKCEKLEFLNLTCTDVGVIHLPDDKDTICSILLEGCPVLSPPYSAYEPSKVTLTTKNTYFKALKSDTQWNVYKAVIIATPNTRVSILNSLVSRKISKLQPGTPLMCSQKYHLSKEKSMTLFECCEEMANLFTSDCTVFILPYDADHDINDICSGIQQRLLPILVKVENAVVMLVGFSESVKKAVASSEVLLQVKKQMEILKTSLQQILRNMFSQLYSQNESIAYKEQLKMGDVYRLLDGIETAELIADVTVTDLQSIEVLQSTLIKAVSRIETLQPVYSNMPSAFTKITESLKPKPGLHHENEIIKELQSVHKSEFGHNYRTYKKALQLLHKAGKIIYFPDAKNSVVVTDFEWFSNELRTSVNSESMAKVSPDMMRLLQDYHLICYQRHSAETSTMLAWASKLPSEPAMPWDYFMETEKFEAVLNLEYGFQFFHPLPSSLRMALLCQLMALNSANDPRYPSSVWQSGFIKITGPVTVGLRFLDAETNKPKISLIAQVVKPRQETYLKSLTKCLWNTLEFYCVILERVVKDFGIYFSMQMNFNDHAESTVPDGVMGVTSGHQMVQMPNTQAINNICQNCSIDEESLCHVWKAKKDLLPTFQSGKLAPSTTGSIQTKGNWIGTNLGEVVIPLPTMTFVDFSHFSFAVLLGKNFAIRIKSPRSASELYFCDVKSLVQRGDVVTILLKEAEETSSQMIEICILINGEVMKKSEPQSAVFFNPYLVIMDQVNFLLDTSLASNMATSLSTWKPGMKVEALDRKTPNLICVATVADVLESGELLIHFDGWSENYDYHADPASSDIHPIGWFAQRIFNHPNYNVTLQPPRNYNRPFEWEHYLIDCLEIPAPYELFTSEQTEDCTPFHLKPETVQHLQSFGKGVDSIEQCGLEKRHPELLATRALEKWTGLLVPQQLDTPLAVFLPRDLNYNHLYHPTNKIMPLLSNQSWHFVCSGRGDCMHFLDLKGIVTDEAGHEAELSDFFQAVASVVTHYELKLPENAKHLAADVGNYSAAELQERFLRFFTILFWNICLLKSEELDDVNLDDLKNKNKQLFVQLWNRLKSNSILKSAFVYDGTESNAVCHAHHHSHSPGKGLTHVSLDAFTNYRNLIVSLDLSLNLLESLPSEFFTMFPVIHDLNLSKNQLLTLPEGIGSCQSLVYVDLSHNQLKKLPADFRNVMSKLRILKICSNPLGTIPDCLFSATLEELHANSIGLKELPSEIGLMVNLVVLKVGENQLHKLPPSFSNLTQLKDLDLSGIRWIEANDTKMLLTQSAFNEFMSENSSTAAIEKKERDALFSKYDEKNLGTLDYQAIQCLNVDLFQIFPRFGQQGNESDPYSGCPEQIFALKSLNRLNLSFQGFQRLTEHIEALALLEELNISHNPALEALPGEISGLSNLREMQLRGCVSLKTPPKEIVRRGFSAVFGYLRRLKMGSVECKRTKLMLVGLGGAGKTSLVYSLTQGQYVSSGSYGEKITDGIDITTWDLCQNEKSLRFSVWDFAGQTVYYNTHQFFLSNRAVYLLLWNIRLGYEHAGLDFWLSSIACHAPKAPIIIIGSHKDQVQKYWFPEVEMKRRYPQIQGFFAVSSFSGEGITELRNKLHEVALKEKYMGERIPEVWLNFERKMLNERANFATLSWDKVEECAYDTGIVENMELFQAVRFLHDLGSVQHFQNEHLKSRVVINPQWIVDAMSCMVSVQNTPIREGRLYLEDLGKIWGRYAEELRPWLLRLTEEFDLTFPSKDESANIIPCLLPASEPEFTWPDISSTVGCKELKMIYKFDYLPAGLFNRIQVRLYQFSDSSLIWKNGSFLQKNGHLALLKTQEASDVLIKVQGPRPENILFLVNEVIETLIAESFHGVHYDYQIPCTDCLKAGSFDPCMFAASKIRRATELKAPFLQCDMYFHTLSLTELQAMMPPDNSNDFDMHLERSLVDLNNLRHDMSYDIFMLYSQDNIPLLGEEQKKVSPRQIFNDLQLSGFNVWFSSDPANVVVEQVTLIMREAKVVLICGSNEFVKDAQCARLFYMAKNSMQKTIQLVILGKGMEWIKTSQIGMLVSSEVFVNMTDSYVAKYKSKFEDLCRSIKTKLMTSQTSMSPPKVFISYCWCNSHDAVAKGTRVQPGSLGWADPRKLKELLEENRISCWMDVERAQAGQLFEEIASGLRHAKVVIVCASDEYAKSRNCMMEFRFAAVQLNLPLILAAVGTSQKWEASEVGMLSLGYPKINFQHEGPDANQRLIEAVRHHITEEETEEDRRTANSPATVADSNQRAFQELLELAQRKFLRQVVSYGDSMESVPYPRLFVLDCLSDEEKQMLKGTSSERTLQDADSADHVNKRVSDTVNETKELEKRPPSQTHSPRPTSASKIRNLIKLVSSNTTSKALPVVSFIVEALATDPVNVSRNYEYCLRILCENEDGWHCAPGFIPLEPMEPVEWDAFLSEIASYMARLLAILKHTTLDLNILVSNKAERLGKILEEKCGTDPDFKTPYVNMRKLVMSLDERQDMCGLSRCRLLNGKVIWLCADHQKKDRITILSNESADIMTDDVAVESEIMSQVLSEKKSATENTKQELSTPVTKTDQQDKPSKPKGYQSSNEKQKSTERNSDTQTSKSAANSSDYKNSVPTRTVSLEKQGKATVSSNPAEEEKYERKTKARGKLVGAEMAARIAGGYSIGGNNTSKACTIM